MSEVKIVEYRPELAKKISEMWQRSSGQPGWNGEIFNFTEETVLKDQAKTSNLNLYLAETDGKIVGYCTLRVYSEDIGALYIGLLNVEPDYMGKKIGKMLVLKCVERTIELGYPRLDLFTWAGNTKAMPLYKKCGFFWEEMDRATHLMNFIPTVMNEDIFKEYFKNADWYEDSRRVIDLVPDARKENKFEYFKYVWDKDGRKLEVDFERRGRGLRRIDCDDYSVEAVVENLELVFGSSYKVRYIVKNKTGKELNISINGLNDRNIDFSYNDSSKVENEKIFEGEFFVNKTDNPQNIWKTHPVVKSEIIINGIKTIFKVGIEPRVPLTVDLQNSLKVYHPGIKYNCYLNIENNFDKRARFHFRLPDNELVEFTNGEFDVELNAKEKASFEMEFTVKKAGIYLPDLNIKVKPEDGAEFSFTRKAVMVFYIENQTFTGHTIRNYVIGNGKYSLYLGYNAEEHNRLSECILTDALDKRERFVFMTPKLGKPYTDEFIKRPPERIETLKRDNYVQMSAHYKTERSEHLEYITHYRLFPNGRLVKWNEFVKSDDLGENIFLAEYFWTDFENSYIPANKNIIKSCTRVRNSISYWQGIETDENWLYTFGEKFRTAFIWPESTKLTIGEWNLSYEYEIPKEKGRFITEEEVFYGEAPSDWKEFRKIATGHDSKDVKHVESFEILINNGDPVMKAENELSVKDLSKKIIKGELKITDGSGKTVLDGGRVLLDCDNDIAINKIVYEKQTALDILNVHSHLGAYEFFDKKLVMNPSESPVMTSAENGTVTADNGILVIKTDSKFAPSLFSLTYNGNEWLDTFYPETGPKSWWGYWFGGLYFLPESIGNKKMLEQNRDAGPVKVSDNFGNCWSGIRITVNFNDFERLNGSGVEQYFLMLPGVPVLWVFARLVNGSGKFLEEWFEMKMFAKTAETLDKHYSIHPANGYRFNAGREMQGVKAEKVTSVSAEGLDHFVNAYSADDEKIRCHLDSFICLIASYNELECPDKQSRIAGSKFIIFNKDKLKADWLNDLKKLTPML